MTSLAWLRAALRQPRAWLALGGLFALVLLGLSVSSQHDWRQRSASLERENLELQLAQLAREFAAQPDQLADRARELADSEAVARLLQENSDASAERLELANMARSGVDALLVLSASRAVRFGVTATNGQLNEQAPDPELTRI